MSRSRSVTWPDVGLDIALPLDAGDVDAPRAQVNLDVGSLRHANARVNLRRSPRADWGPPTGQPLRLRRASLCGCRLQVIQHLLCISAAYTKSLDRRINLQCCRHRQLLPTSPRPDRPSVLAGSSTSKLRLKVVIAGDGSQFETIDSPCRLAAGTNGKTYRQWQPCNTGQR